MKLAADVLQEGPAAARGVLWNRLAICFEGARCPKSATATETFSNDGFCIVAPPSLLFWRLAPLPCGAFREVVPLSEEQGKPDRKGEAVPSKLIVSEDDELHLTLDALAAAMSAMQRGAMRGEK